MYLVTVKTTRIKKIIVDAAMDEDDARAVASCMTHEEIDEADAVDVEYEQEVIDAEEY